MEWFGKPVTSPAKPTVYTVHVVYVRVHTCVYARGYCATMNRIVKREKAD